MSATLTDNALTILSKRYLEGESVDSMWDRVSGGNPRFRKLLEDLVFLPNSPTLFNAGRKNGCTLSACFVLSFQDAMFGRNSITDIRNKAIAIAKAGGGVGYYFGNLRPKGSAIKSIHRKACGPVAVLRDMHAISHLITQGGKRELAQMGVLNCDHQDIRDFIHCKDNDPQGLGSFNISVGWYDRWVKEVTRGAGEENNLWMEQCRAAWHHGCPGMFFPDRVNRDNPNKHLGLIDAPNPCVTGDTLLLTDRGYQQISRLVGETVRVWNGEEWSAAIPKVTGHNQKITKIVFNDGRFLDCTDYHGFYLKDGSRVQAKDLQFGDQLEDYVLPTLKTYTGAVLEGGPQVLKVAGFLTMPVADTVYCVTEPKRGKVTFNGINSANCGETPNRGTGEPCNLGSIVLGHFFDSATRTINWNYLEEVIYTASEFLDDILDRNEFPHPDITEAALLTRKLGLGAMGWADLLSMMHIHYDTQEAVDLAGKVSKFIADVSHRASEDMAKKKGPYKGYSDKTEAPCRRNETSTSIAPTGTIGIIGGVKGFSIEPWYALSNTRKTNEGLTLMEDVPEWIRDKLDGFVPKTAHEITPEWHVKHQAAWQQNVDLGVSKCVERGTLVMTASGICPIECLSTERRDDTFRDLSVELAGEKGVVHTSRFYSGGVKKVLRIRTDQGSNLSGTPNHKVRIEEDGEVVWKPLQEVSVGDLLVIKLGYKMFPSECDLDGETARLYGHLIADGSILDHAVLLTHTNPVVNEDRRNLLNLPWISEVIHTERNTRNSDRPVKMVEDGRKPGLFTVRRNGRGLSRHLETSVGMFRGAANKTIPISVLRATWPVQREFLRGLFTDCGVGDRVGANLSFNTASQQMARSLRFILMNVGIYTTWKCKAGPGKYSSNIYHRLYFPSIEAMKLYNAVGFIEPSRQAIFEAWKSLDGVEKYDKLGRLIRSNNSMLPPARQDYRVERVGSVTPGEATVYDVEVPGCHSFITEGMVSHNTINLPNSATVEDVSNIYKMLHETGCKGGTIFRDGCRSEQVLVTSKTKSVYSLPESLPTNGHTNGSVDLTVPRITSLSPATPPVPTLPNQRDGFVRKFKVGDTTGYLTVGLFPDGRPAEIFLRVSKIGSAISGMLDTWAISFSIALQGGVPLETLCKHHIGTRFEPAGLTQCPDVPVATSIPDYVCRWLVQYFNGRSPDGKTEEVKVHSGQLCPECGAEAILLAGCLSCPQTGCGWSKCG